MYRNLAIVAAMLLSLTACNEDKAQQAEQTTAKAATTMAHAIAVQPEVVVDEVTPAEVVVEVEEASAQPAAAQVVAEDNQAPAPQSLPCAEAASTEVTSAAIDYTTSIVSVQLENKFGPVFIPHSMHAELYACSICHGDGAPGKIDKTKKQFHATCRGCHAKIDAGPTKCGACHQRSK
ncbi:MAG: cytochrome c3 family protein [Desulfuromonas sp.]|nr:cytochrome c3 family protein [Desulfuromonas sp.]